jgi:hypothetical protein
MKLLPSSHAFEVAAAISSRQEPAVILHIGDGGAHRSRGQQSAL